MGIGWRRAFCTTIPRNPFDSPVLGDPSPSSRKLRFFKSSSFGSNPSTLRNWSLRSKSTNSNTNDDNDNTNTSTPRLHLRPKTNEDTDAKFHSSVIDNLNITPRLRCKTKTKNNIKSSAPTTIIPSKLQTTAANSKSKKRVRLAPETEEIVKNGKLSKAWKSVKCSVCGIAGHNRITCLRHGGTQSFQTGPKQKCSSAKGKGKQVPQKVAAKKTHPKGNKVVADKQAEGTGVVESQDDAVEGTCVQSEIQDQATQDVATDKQGKVPGVQSESQVQATDDPSIHDESQSQSQQHDQSQSQSQSQVHSISVQAVSVSSQPTARRMTRQQATLERMMASP